MKTILVPSQNQSLILYKSPKSYAPIYLVNAKKPAVEVKALLPEILFITSFPNRECGIAMYCEDLLKSIQAQFGSSFAVKVCALESDDKEYDYPDCVKYILKTNNFNDYYDLAEQINDDSNISLVFIQHEFGLFGGEMGDYFIQLLSLINKPVVTTFHTVLPHPDFKRINVVKAIAMLTDKIVVMTKTSSKILQNEYNIPIE